MLHEQLRRRPVPRRGTQNEPREKENEQVNTEQAMEQTTSMTNDTHLRDGENVACVLRATQQLTFSGEGRPAQQPKRSSRQRNRTISRRKCTHNHVLQASFATLGPAAMMTTLRRRRAAAQPERSPPSNLGLLGDTRKESLKLPRVL